jgi:hypothetical protein
VHENLFDVWICGRSLRIQDDSSSKRSCNVGVQLDRQMDILAIHGLSHAEFCINANVCVE